MPFLLQATPPDPSAHAQLVVDPGPVDFCSPNFVAVYTVATPA